MPVQAPKIRKSGNPSIFPSHPVHDSRGIVADVQGAFRADRQTDWSSHPYTLSGFSWPDPSADEILRRPLRLTLVVELYANDLVSGGHAAVPGTVKSHEKASAILRREHFARVKQQTQRSRMGLHLDGGGNRLRAVVVVALSAV